MVNVTKANFLAQLSDFLEYLPTASYVAIDEEMSGISLPETSWSDNKMELPSERYARCLKGVPERYSVLQVGVSLFHRNPKYNNQNRCEQQEEEMNSLLGKLNNNELEDLLIDHDVMAEEGDDNDDDDDDDDDDETEYTARIYNFYLFPKKREMTMNPSTIEFLLDNHMDFDKVFREGVPCATFDEANILKKRYFDRYHAPPPAPKTGNVNGGEENGTNNNQSTPLKKNRVRLTKVDDIAFVARAMAGLREWIDSDNTAMANVAAAVMNDDDTNVAAVVAVPDDAAARFANVGGDLNGSTIHHNHNGINTGDTRKKDTSHVLPACNSFLRRCLYETIEDEYPGLILERADIQDASWNAGVIGGGKDQIRVIRLNPVEKELRETRLRREAWDEVLMDCGFATIFHALSDACHGKKFTKRRTRAFLDGMSPELTWSSSAAGRTIPVVVHNGLMDLMFLLTHCHHPTLPKNFEDTKRIIQNYFPFVFDTKVIADEYSDAIIKSGSTNLGDLYTITYGNSGILSPDGTNLSLSNSPALIMNQDGKGQGQAHEAAWDAYMTGCVFFALCGRILDSKSYKMSLEEILHGPSTMVDDGRSQLRTLIGANLIYMHRSLYTIDLESSGPITGLFDPLSCGLSFDTTFHVSGITSSVSTRDILRSLWTGNESEEEVIRELKYEIIWVDDASFFVGTRSMSDFHLAVTRGLVASHVRNALHGGLGNTVNILSLKDYFINKNLKVPHSAGIVSSFLSVASKPFLALQSKLVRMMGFGEKRSSEDDSISGRTNKRMKFN